MEKRVCMKSWAEKNFYSPSLISQNDSSFSLFAIADDGNRRRIRRWAAEVVVSSLASRLHSMTREGISLTSTLTDFAGSRGCRSLRRPSSLSSLSHKGLSSPAQETPFSPSCISFFPELSKSLRDISSTVGEGARNREAMAMIRMGRRRGGSHAGRVRWWSKRWSLASSHKKRHAVERSSTGSS